MDNNRRNSQPDKVVVIITANEKASGIIQTPKQAISFSLEAGQQLIREFDGEEEGVIHRESGQVEYRPFRITSSGDLAVHAINGRQYSTDGTVVLPYSSLSTEYLVMAHYDVFGPGQNPGSNQNFESTLLVVATENDTEIEIIPAARTVNTIPAGAPIRIVLNEGESYQVKAEGDLTGSRIKVLNANQNNCNLIAVFGGNKTSSAGDCGTSGDHIFQQAYPIQTWGKEYIHIPLAGRTSGEIVKVLASQDGTVVRINGEVKATLNARQSAKFEFGKNDIARIDANKPISAAVIAKSAACNEFGVAPLGDPSLFVLSPNSQMLKNIIFSTGKLIGGFNQNIEHYLTLLVNSGTEGQTTLNGQNVGGNFSQVSGTNLSYTRIKVPFGVNSVSNPEGLIGYVYGSGSIESYGFAIGASLENVQFETETSYDFEVEGEKVACLNQEGLWKIIPDDPKFINFTWDFGDGSISKSGQEVSHIFTKKGTYEVVITASTGTGACDSETEFKFELEVTFVEADLKGPASLCPGAEGIRYYLENSLNIDQVIWEIEGGEITQSNEEFALVNWDVVEGTGLIRLTPIAENGCLGEVLEIEVEIQNNIEPEIPSGQAGLCGSTIEPLTYTVPYPVDGKDYFWQVSGGQILSGQSTEEIVVLWDENASERSVFYEESLSSDPSCFGVSKILNIGSFDALTVTEGNKISPSCPGESDGEIFLSIEGGSGDFIFEWEGFPENQEDYLKNIPAGSYQVKVIDQAGCGEIQLNISLEDPDPILINRIAVTDVSCAAESNGGAVLEISGGEPPFQVIGFESEWDGARLSFSGLSKGTFQLLLEDSKSCTLPFELVINGPDPLDLEFEELAPGCPGGLDGALEVKVFGGTPPYTYQWENGEALALLENLPSGEFSVTVTDSQGCQISGLGKVSESRPQVRMPTGFSPKDGPYQPISNCSISYKLMIFNRWGQLIFSGTEGWDGNHNANPMPPGAYSYYISYQYSLENGLNTDEKRGTFTLIN